MPLIIRFVWPLLGASTIAYHLYLIFSGLVPNLVSRPFHMALALPWALVFISETRVSKLTGILLTGIGLFICFWIAINEAALGDQYGALENNFQITMSIMLLVIVLEMARRAIGWPLPVVALLAILYGLLGQNIPGEFGFTAIPLSSFLGTLTIAEGGIWGKLTGISVNIVSIFVIFGVILNSGEAGQGFMNLASLVAGHLKGGAAKVSVISSALFGSISGSASANVASTGAITLPAMIRLNYPRPLAAAIEAVASSGGQIMPPLMGAGAFVMVELTGVPYIEIMKAALLPAMLYFIAVWVGINAFTHRYELKGLPANEQPRIKQVLVTTGFFVLPFSILIWAMFGPGFTPQYAASWAILAAALLLLLDGRLSFQKRRTLERCYHVFMGAGQQVSTIASIIICASIIVGVLGITGLGVKITSMILSGSGGMIWPALLLTALACLVLGMEVPTTAAYVICISVSGPALISLGLEPLQAHLFVFWFALLSTITPPVCGAVFIAASMVNENWLKVSMIAMALGLGLYLIPLGMIANPDLTKFGIKPLSAFFSMCKVGIALTMISFGLISPKTYWLRIGLVIVGGVLLFI
jgi:TRAP transporter 4TM/12TM fusion protein